MNFLLTWIYWGLAALLYLHHAKLSQAAPSPGEVVVKREGEVVSFLDVYSRSFCKPIETLVNVNDEYSEEVETIFKPSCILVKRCGGCCNDEALECVATDMTDITMEIMQVKHSHSQSLSQMTFKEHTSCECRRKTQTTAEQEKKSKRGKGKGQKRKRKRGRYKPQNFHCEPCSERRKHLFKQDPQTCKCSCKFTDSRCKSRQLELNERTCRCDRPRR